MAQAWISSYGMHVSISRLQANVEKKLKPWVGPTMGWQEFHQYDLGTAVLTAVNLDFAMVASQQIITMSMHPPGTQELTGFDFQPNSNLMKLRGRHQGHLIHLERDPDGYMVDFVAAPHVTVHGEKDVRIMDSVVPAEAPIAQVVRGSSVRQRGVISRDGQVMMRAS